MKRPILAYGLPLLAMTFLCFMGLRLALKAEPPRAEPALPPAQARFDARIAGIGVVEPKSEVIAIGTPIAGIVQAVYVPVGATVAQGDALFTIDTREAQAAMESAKARIAVAEAALGDAKAQLDFSMRIVDKGAVSLRERSTREYAVKRAEGELATAKAALAEIETVIERSTVRAPVDGTILKLNVRTGEFAQAAASARDPLITMGDLSDMHVRVEIDETDAQLLKPGQKAEGFLRGQGSRAIALQFVRLEPLLVPKRSLTGDGNERVDTRVLEIIYSFKNNKIDAFIGQQMDVFIQRK